MEYSTQKDDRRKGGCVIVTKTGRRKGGSEGQSPKILQRSFKYGPMREWWRRVTKFFFLSPCAAHMLFLPHVRRGRSPLPRFLMLMIRTRTRTYLCGLRCGEGGALPKLASSTPSNTPPGTWLEKSSLSHKGSFYRIWCPLGNMQIPIVPLAGV